MNTDNYKDLFDQATQALGSFQLFSALDAMKTASQELRQSYLITEEESIRNDYALMLQFMAQGGNDPQKENMHQTFLLRACNLLYRIHHQYLLLYGSNHIGETMRTDQTISSDDPNSYIEALLKPLSLLEDYTSEGDRNKESIEHLYQDLYRELNRFFNYLLTADLFDEEKKRLVISCINRLPEVYACMLLEALYLNCMEALDLNKLKILFHFVRSNSVRLSIQALTAVLILYHQHSSLIEIDEVFHHEFLMLKEVPGIDKAIISIQKQLFLSKETEKASQILNKDILPNMMRSGLGNLNQMDPNMSIDSLLQGNMGGMGAALENNMEHLSKMTQTGYDINYNLFSSMCRNIFFSKFNNWFCNFDLHHPDLADFRKNEQGEKMLQTLGRSQRLCELDKYAMGYILNHMPESMRGAMLEGGMQMEIEDQSIVPDPEKEKQSVIRSHIQDLYRFYTKSLQKKNLKNPFDAVPFFAESNPVMQIVNKGEFLNEMARFFMKTELYQQAQDALLALLEIQSADAWALHSLAVTYQQQGASARALQYEQQAELLDPDNINILLSIQQLCLFLDKHTMRVNYLKRIEELQPLDTDLEIGMVFSLIESEQYEEALKRCYKMKYLEQNSSFADRSIAWCSLKTQKPETAQKYYDQLLAGNGIIWGDYLNAGNTAWINGNIQKAISHYRIFIREFGKSSDSQRGTWMDAFEENEEILESYGINRRDICLMKEIIRPENQQ